MLKHLGKLEEPSQNQLQPHFHPSYQSLLSRHKHFNLTNGVVIDVMHCVFLGVVGKTLMKYWLDTAYRTAPFSIRRKVMDIILSTALLNSPCTIVRWSSVTRGWQTSVYHMTSAGHPGLCHRSRSGKIHVFGFVGTCTFEYCWVFFCCFQHLSIIHWCCTFLFLFSLTCYRTPTSHTTAYL